MPKISETRSSDSPFIQSVTRVKYTVDSIDVEPPDGHWAIVVIQHRGETQVLHTGMATQPVTLRFEKDDEYIGISFRPSIFLPCLPAKQLVNVGMVLPKVNHRNFWLGTRTFEIPTFANAESLVRKLVDNEMLAINEIVDTILKDRPQSFSTRSIQRHFGQTTGITLKYFLQIQRARQASRLLETGVPAIEAALEAGYYDQSHMANSLKKIIGKTPTEIVQASIK